jgi:hypothetical protein
VTIREGYRSGEYGANRRAHALSPFFPTSSLLLAPALAASIVRYCPLFSSLWAISIMTEPRGICAQVPFSLPCIDEWRRESQLISQPFRSNSSRALRDVQLRVVRSWNGQQQNQAKRGNWTRMPAEDWAVYINIITTDN